MAVPREMMSSPRRFDLSMQRSTSASRVVVEVPLTFERAVVRGGDHKRCGDGQHCLRCGIYAGAKDSLMQDKVMSWTGPHESVQAAVRGAGCLPSWTLGRR